MITIRCSAIFISRAIFLLFVLAALVACPTAPKTAQIQVRIKSELSGLPASQVIPRVNSERDGSAILLTKKTATGDSVYWWGNQNIADRIGEPIILVIYLTFSDTTGILADTALVQDNRRITYVAYFGVAPEYGADQNVYRKFPLNDHLGDTLFLGRDIADDRPAL